MIQKLNPWKIPTLTDNHYNNLIKLYSLDTESKRLKNDPVFFKRNLIIGHDNFNKWIDEAEKGNKVALVSGFMTSGFLHLGSLTVIKQMAYYQKNYNADVIIPIADLEAKCVRKTSDSEVKNVIVDFIAHFIAAGLDMNKTKIYLQTRNLDVLSTAGLFTSKLDIGDLNEIYDRKLTLGEAFSSLVMASDILTPQIEDYKSTLITLGIDEISHFILTKKLISKLGNEFYMPSITYNKILTGLNGSKMGKSIPENSILLSDNIELVKDKLLGLRKLDVELNQNSAFNILQWYSKDDSIITNIIQLEKKNKLDAKLLAIDEAIKLVSGILEDHQNRYKKSLGDAEKMAKTLMKNGQ